MPLLGPAAVAIQDDGALPPWGGMPTVALSCLTSGLDRQKLGFLLLQQLVDLGDRAVGELLHV
ncbi:MAG: hypothetical protein WD886_09080, partial [Burkholderiales bacterium]